MLKIYHFERNKELPFGSSLFRLNNPRFLEGGKSAVLLDSLEAFHGEVKDNCLPELGDVNATLLEVSLATDFTSGVKLRRADAV